MKSSLFFRVYDVLESNDDCVNKVLKIRDIFDKEKWDRFEVESTRADCGNWLYEIRINYLYHAGCGDTEEEAFFEAMMELILKITREAFNSYKRGSDEIE